MSKPTCHLEVINPDDVLVVGVNNKWFRTFTSSSDRYPLKLQIPAAFLNDAWNLVSGNYTNVALVGKNEANVEYKIFLEGNEVVHVVYRCEVQPESFAIHFKDTFSLKQRSIERGSAPATKRQSRFNEMMSWHKAAPDPPPEEEGDEIVDLPPTPLPSEDEDGGGSGRRIGRPKP